MRVKLLSIRKTLFVASVEGEYEVMNVKELPHF